MIKIHRNRNKHWKCFFHFNIFFGSFSGAENFESARRAYRSFSRRFNGAVADATSKILVRFFLVLHSSSETESVVWRNIEPYLTFSTLSIAKKRSTSVSFSENYFRLFFLLRIKDAFWVGPKRKVKLLLKRLFIQNHVSVTDVLQ